MAEFDQKYGGHVKITQTAGATLTGGQIVKLTGDNTVSPGTAGAPFAGIAGHDAKQGEPVVVHFLTVGFVVAAEKVVAGDYVKSGADGKAAKSANKADACGLVLAGAEANAKALIRFGI